MASFPGAVYSPANVNTGETIQAVTINNAVAEITAIEDGYRNATAPLNSSGSTLATLSVLGASTLVGNVVMTGKLQSSNSTLTALNVTSSNSTLQELFVTVPPPSVRAFNGVGVDVPNNAATVVTFNSDRFINPTSMHSTAVNASRLVAPSSGVYLATAHVAWNAFSSVGIREIRLLVNGVTIIAADRTRVDPSVANITPQTISALYNLSANDYVEMNVLQDSGSTGSLGVQANYSPEMALIKIR